MSFSFPPSIRTVNSGGQFNLELPKFLWKHSNSESEIFTHLNQIFKTTLESSSGLFPKIDFNLKQQINKKKQKK
jgi:hypothetical protein